MKRYRLEEKTLAKLEINKCVIKNIKKLLKENEMTQGDLCGILELSRDIVSRKMNEGERSPMAFNILELYTLSKYFNLPVDYFLE